MATVFPHLHASIHQTNGKIYSVIRSQLDLFQVDFEMFYFNLMELITEQASEMIENVGKPTQFIDIYIGSIDKNDWLFDRIEHRNYRTTLRPLLAQAWHGRSRFTRIKIKLY